MTFQAILDAEVTSAIGNLADFDRDAALRAGMADSRIRDLAAVHRAYYGPTRFKAKQREARAAADANKVSLDKLVTIERRLKAVSDDRERWALRLRLLSVRGKHSTLTRVARELVPAEVAPRTPGVKFTRSKDQLRSMIVTASERALAELERYLSEGIDRTAPSGPQMLATFLRLMRGGHSVDAAGQPDDGDGRPSGVPHSQPEPLILIPLPEWVKIHSGAADEVTLRLTDDTTMTGADYLNRFLANEDYFLQAALFHPTEGPVNLYRVNRFANSKQRTLLRATTPMCPVPGCRRSADQCQYHHIRAWKDGGETNLDNLSVACHYHNGVNDDDPTKHRRGRVENFDGDRVWVSPTGHPVSNCDYGALSQLFGHETRHRRHTRRRRSNQQRGPDRQRGPGRQRVPD
ncbi:HNH endonuclease signature motif containing protein [Corynebacterium aquatimens]|uniref:HNH nuclease domain-containing protein n=1 Tax=Corynebacterium aquatimens TaxID=1190508 RepID=A0A931E0B0_9CORY|nr:HNH endonuclease signature motif containing protein [Corynebacterium aquatimens]MBG6121255.1 hypothetical protein [Corynebacterium aquatimens]WJY66194.1 hypothetical protein CAQUA_07490 [Corynebacterium aquatimens]